MTWGCRRASARCSRHFALDWRLKAASTQVEGKVRKIGSSTTLYKIEGRWDRSLTITGARAPGGRRTCWWWWRRSVVDVGCVRWGVRRDMSGGGRVRVCVGKMGVRLCLCR
eukprot:3829266-Rhodomonas_salina.1